MKNIIQKDTQYLSKKIPSFLETSLPSKSISNTISLLKETRKAYGGLGVSANQIRIMDHRVFVIGTDHYEMVCINPEIIKTSKEQTTIYEGCLSYLGLTLPISRPSSIEVSYYDENGNHHYEKLTGLTARCFQHELDHLNGIIFTEHVSKLVLDRATKKQQKQIKKIQREQNQPMYQN
jgi:peptide deformylase